MIELVGLAYDASFTNRIWSELSVRETYDLILADEFRRKVDFRSMLYHKGHLDLLSRLESCLRQGGAELTLVDLLARRFQAGVEEFPVEEGELAFDFQLIRHFSSLAMVDDFMVADPFLRELLRKVGFLKNGAGWSLLEVRDFEGVAKALREVQMQDVIEVGRNVGKDMTSPVRFENLVRNYIEFLHYAHNNRLTPFFYNSQSDFRRWGDLTSRKNLRSERVVDLAMKGPAPKAEVGTPSGKIGSKQPPNDIREKARIKRQSESLLPALSDPDPLIRQKAAESLERIADHAILPYLLAALSDEESEVRHEVVRALGTFDNPEATAALFEVVQKEEIQTIRLTAAFFLKQKGERKLIPLLLDAIEAGSPHFSAILAYHPALAEDRASQARLETLAHHSHPLTRREVAFVLGRLPGASSIKILSFLIQDPDEETRCAALYSLWELGAESVPSHAKRLSEHVSELTARAGRIVSKWMNT